MTWEVAEPWEESKSPTEKQLDYINFLLGKIWEQRIAVVDEDYRPDTREEASEMIDNLKDRLGWERDD